VLEIRRKRLHLNTEIDPAKKGKKQSLTIKAAMRHRLGRVTDRDTETQAT
jgi:hypothetical protein